MQTLKSVFMGTPDFAVPALQALAKAGHNIAMVVTKQDMPKGRGRKIVETPVKVAAIKAGYKIAQPVSVKTEEFLDIIKGLEPDLIITSAFGHILPPKMLSIPKLGAINIHASLLPKYRGPSPIQSALINRESHTGVTTIIMAKGTDTGDILMQAKEKIYPDDTAGTLHNRLAKTGAKLLIQTIEGLLDKSVKPAAQDETEATYAKLLKKKDGLIDWNKKAEDIEAFIRAMNPWPGAFTFHDNRRYKIFSSKLIARQPKKLKPAEFEVNDNRLIINTGNGLIEILEIQGDSSKKMPVKDFLRGVKLNTKIALK